MRWWRRKQREQDLERELRADLELEAAEQQQNGLSAGEARYAAQRALGNATLVKEEVREMWGFVFLDRLKQDVSYALRGMRKSPGFTATAVLSLALGIGANTAIFSLIDAVLLRWLPVRDPQELVQLTMRGIGPEPVQSFAYPVVRALADHREIFSNLCGFSGARFGVGEGDSFESTSGAWVTGGYYATLGIQPAAGRLLTESDDRPGAIPVAVITDGYWQRKFGRNPLAIGQQILVEGKPVTLVGVSSGGFTGANVGETADITLPLGVLPQIQSDRQYTLESAAWWLRVLARPQPGVSHTQVKARLAVIWRPLGESVIPARMPGARRRVQQSTLDVTSGGTGYSDLRRQFRRPLLVLMAVVGLLLTIACANVANLLLARAAARQREIAVRLAIGASRARIIRQLLTESLLLSLFGGALGILLAWAGSRVLVDLLSSGRVHALALDVAPDWRVLLFTGAAASATGILFGLAPAFRGTAAGPTGALREKIAIARSRLAPLLVTAQVSLALLLLIGAGLFVRTLQNLHRVDAGFQRNGVLTVNADGTRTGYRGARAAAFYEELLQQIEGLPGVKSASFSLITPLSGGAISQQIAINGQPASQQEILFNSVSRRYFETMGTAVVLGREFTLRDHADAPQVAIVNQAFARRYLPEGGTLGQRLTVGSTRLQEFEVAGVVRDSIYQSLREAALPTVYVPLVQRAGPGGFGVVFEVHAAGSLAQVAAALRTSLQPMRPGAPVEVRTLTEQVERTLVQERLMATLAASFGILGLVLAVVGLYGLLAYTVARRTNEIGIRLALGAMRQEVLWMVIRHVLALLGIGIAIGIPVAWAASRFVSSMLFGVVGTDPLTIGAATAALTAAGLLAGFLPAWRAAQVDPMVALRYE
jgi:predicted permease